MGRIIKRQKNGEADTTTATAAASTSAPAESAPGTDIDSTLLAIAVNAEVVDTDTDTDTDTDIDTESNDSNVSTSASRAPSIAWSENDRDLAVIQALAAGINTLPTLYAHLKADSRFEGTVLTPLKITQRLGVLRKELRATKGITLPRLQASPGDRRRGRGAGRRYVPDVDTFADILNAAGVAVPVDVEESEEETVLERSASAEAQVGA